MQALSEYIYQGKNIPIREYIQEKLIVNKNYVGEQLPEYMIVLTKPKVQWKSYWNRAVTEAKIWGEFCSAISNLTYRDNGHGNATKEKPTLFRLSKPGKGINAGPVAAYKIFAGNDVFYIKPLKPGYKRSGIEISRRELDSRESGKYNGTLATGRWQIDKDVTVSDKGYGLSPDLINLLISIMEEE